MRLFIELEAGQRTVTLTAEEGVSRRRLLRSSLSHADDSAVTVLRFLKAFQPSSLMTEYRVHSHRLMKSTDSALPHTLPRGVCALQKKISCPHPISLNWSHWIPVSAIPSGQVIDIESVFPLRPSSC